MGCQSIFETIFNLPISRFVGSLACLSAHSPLAPAALASPWLTRAHRTIRYISMPSTSPPPPHHYTFATTSQYAATGAHSWGRFGFHQHRPAAMYDTTSDIYSPQDYPSTDHIARPPSFTFSSPTQQAAPPSTRYPSPMSRHPAWAYGYTQLHSVRSPVDARPSAFEPPVAHKVWLLECKHCLTFLTNRGMKVRVVCWHARRAVIDGRSSPQAVLLLRPHVALFSTDALPVNCSAYSARPPPSIECQLNEQQPRTCECLTQTLCCHGCGTNVGYTIVVPVRAILKIHMT
jgi:hypothetical protein